MESIDLKKVDVLLDNDKIKYQSGETIRGTVKIALNGELDLSRVNIVLRAMCAVNLVELYDYQYREDCDYRETEQYLNVVYKIQYKKGNSIITAGEHSIPFEFKLEDNILTSFESDRGSIKYWIEVIIGEGVIKSQLYSNKKSISVDSPFRKDIHLSVGGRTEKDFAFSPLASGKVRIDASIRKKGHIPGETVEVHCVVTNASTVAVTPRAKLYQIEIYMAKDRHKTQGCASDAVIGQKVNASENGQQTISVQIPNDTLLSIKSRLISIKYFIHVTLDVPHAYDLHLNLPIIITNENALCERMASFI